MVLLSQESNVLINGLRDHDGRHVLGLVNEVVDDVIDTGESRVFKSEIHWFLVIVGP